MWNIAICDDNKDVLDDLFEKVIEYYGNNSGAIIKYEDEKELLEDIKKGKEYHIVLMDIDLNGTNGIEIANKIFVMNIMTQVIFISAYEKYFQDVYYAKHVYFLIKPIEIEKLAIALTMAHKNLSEMESEVFAISHKGIILNLRQSEILYFEKVNRKVMVVTKKNSYTISGRITDPLERLDGSFVRCHGSFLVNLKQVKSMSSTNLELVTGENIPISRTFRQKVRDRYIEILERQL